MHGWRINSWYFYQQPLLKLESGFIKLGGDGTSYCEGFGVKFDGESYEITLTGFDILSVVFFIFMFSHRYWNQGWNFEAKCQILSLDYEERTHFGHHFMRFYPFDAKYFALAHIFNPFWLYWIIYLQHLKCFNDIFTPFWRTLFLIPIGEG